MASAVLVDTLVVCALLVPAILSYFDKIAWWPTIMPDSLVTKDDGTSTPLTTEMAEVKNEEENIAPGNGVTQGAGDAGGPTIDHRASLVPLPDDSAPPTDEETGYS